MLRPYDEANVKGERENVYSYSKGTTGTRVNACVRVLSSVCVCLQGGRGVMLKTPENDFLTTAYCRPVFPVFPFVYWTVLSDFRRSRADNHGGGDCGRRSSPDRNAD